MSNNGPDVAHGVGLGLAWSRAVDGVRLQAPPNWTCEPPRVDTDRTSTACSLAALALDYHGQSEQFRVFVPTVAAQAGTGLSLASRRPRRRPSVRRTTTPPRQRRN